jgi:hypothetical protein
MRLKQVLLRRKLEPITFASRHAQNRSSRAMTIVTRPAYHFEDLEIGMEASFAKTVSQADIVSFADVTGDKNPVHLDADMPPRAFSRARSRTAC